MVHLAHAMANACEFNALHSASPVCRLGRLNIPACETSLAVVSKKKLALRAMSPRERLYRGPRVYVGWQDNSRPPSRGFPGEGFDLPRGPRAACCAAMPGWGGGPALLAVRPIGFSPA